MEGSCSVGTLSGPRSTCPAPRAANHAQGLAFHGARLGVPVTIVMPKTTPFVKVQHTRDFGAEGVRSCSACRARACAEAAA